MDMDKLGLSLFDILGYLIPGLVVLLGFSLIESTFIQTNLLSLKTIANNWLFAAIGAYFLGITCHILATIGKGTSYRLFGKKEQAGKNSSVMKSFAKIKQSLYQIAFGNNQYQLSDPLYQKVKQKILDTYHFDEKEREKIPYIERYLLADSYLVASGVAEERLSLLVREGFFKTSYIAFGILLIISVAATIKGGLIIQPYAGQFISLGLRVSIIAIFTLFIVFILFRNRYNYYNRIKINNTFLLFLAIREKEEQKQVSSEVSMLSITDN